MEILQVGTPYQLVKTRHGWFLANPVDVYLGRALLAYGECCEFESQMLDQLVRPGKDVIEVGANIGVHTIPMARKLEASGRRLLAVEPQPVIFQNLCANLALNGLLNTTVELAACSNQPGWLSFASPDYRQQGNFGGIAMQLDGVGNQRVRSLRLDDLVPANFDVGLVKIDVEGFERQVLEGAQGLLGRFRPFVYIENDRLEHSKALIEWLWAADYALWWHIPALFNPDNFAGNAENIYGNVASFNMVGMPKELKVVMQGFTPVEDADAHPLKP
jgi:FkbM family methyltransferase